MPISTIASRRASPISTICARAGRRPYAPRIRTFRGRPTRTKKNPKPDSKKRQETMSEAKKIAVVTGAGTGVGRAAALALMNTGFTVVLAGRRKEMLEETSKLGDNIGKSLPVVADMTKPESIAALFQKVKDT